MNIFRFILKILFFIVLLINSICDISAQSKELKKHIQDKLVRIDERIAAKDFDLALTKLEELEAYKDFISNKENKLTIDFKRAQAYLGKDEQQKAMDLLLFGLDELKLLNFPKLKLSYTKYLGKIFESAKNYSKSRYYHQLSLDDSLERFDTINMLDSNLLIGLTFYNENKIDSAIYYLKEVIDFNANKNTSKIISKAYNNLSVISLEEEDYDLAEEYSNKSLSLKQSQNDTVEIAIAFMNLSNILYRKKDFNKVKENYLNAYKKIKSINTAKAFSLKENLLYNLAFVSEELKDFENAFQYLLEAAYLTDSLVKANVAKNISEIEAKYNVEKANREAEEQKYKRNRTLAWFYSSIFIFITFIALSYIFYRNYKLKRSNEVDKLINETQTKIINATIDAKEKERKSIAQILHDSVSALLSSANLHLQATKAQLKTNYPPEINKAQNIVNEASVKIRDLSHELISSVLLKFGLAFAVHDMCQKYSNSELSLFSDDDGVKRYDQDFEIKIYNIIEELVNNILKHSKADNATIMLAHKEKDMLSIRLNDDGIGFDTKKAKTNGGLGLSHIEARIKVMKGVFNIVSSKVNGTSTFIIVPIKY